MTTVRDLRPGDLVRLNPDNPGAIVAATVTGHPLYERLALVVWRLHDGTWSLDALSWDQDVGEINPPTNLTHRRQRLEEAFRRPPR